MAYFQAGTDGELPSGCTVLSLVSACERTAMGPGEYVEDADDDNPDLAIVVSRPDATIADIPVGDGDRTVADDNPEYDANEPAVVVAFVESGLDNHWPEWTDAAVGNLYEAAQANNVKCYTFPESRLSTVSEQRAQALRMDTAIDVEGLQARLENAGWDVDPTPNGGLSVQKIGEQYQITPAGKVEGDGQVQEPLKNLVAQYTE